LPEVFRVASPDFDQITVIACNMMYFKDFCAVGQGASDVLVRRGLVASDGHEGEEPEAQRFGVDLSAIASDHSPGFELADPLQHSRGGKPDRPGDFSLGFPGVRLELVENLEVYGIERSFKSHLNRIIVAC
jgi:hypothetical protein